MRECALSAESCEISFAPGFDCELERYGHLHRIAGNGYCGVHKYGIGTHLHEDPEVPNFAMKRKGLLLQPGMTLAVETMINMGTYEVVWMDDDWTVVTKDHSLSAHYENTILITEGEPEILSL